MMLSGNSVRRFVLMLLIMMLFLFMSAEAVQDQSEESVIFKSYIKNRDKHSNIPDNSYAGYQYGEKPVPQYQVIANVRDYGAKGDGRTESAKAVNDAVFAAHQKGGGAVLIPAGTYLISDEIWMCYDNVVLRGEGTGKTVLKTDKSLSETYKGKNERINNKNSEWLNCGGFIWFSPENELSRMRIVQGWKTSGNAFITENALLGDRRVIVSDIGRFVKGQKIIILYGDDDNKTYQREIFRDIKLAQDKSCDEWGRISDKVFKSNFQFTAEITGIEGNAVVLKQPLRIPVIKGTKILSMPQMIKNSGIEKLTIQMKADDNYAHHEEKGYNAVYFNNAWDCWANDIEIINWENGIIFWFSKCITVKNIVLKGDGRHTAFHFARSSDCLIMNYESGSKLVHGITFDSFACGNVCSNGDMKHGCLDYHRALAFDNIITNLTIGNDGMHGGLHAPRFGGRNVNWNITVTNARPYMISSSNLMPYGVIAGIKGCGIYNEADADYKGDVKTVIEALGKNVLPDNLYFAQVNLRLGYIPDHLK